MRSITVYATSWLEGQWCQYVTLILASCNVLFRCLRSRLSLALFCLKFNCENNNLKEDPYFLKKSELWLVRVVNMCNPRTIWHWGFQRYYLKSSQLKQFDHTTITSFAGYSKKTFFCPYSWWWNNHLQIPFLVTKRDKILLKNKKS